MKSPRHHLMQSEILNPDVRPRRAMPPKTVDDAGVKLMLDALANFKTKKDRESVIRCCVCDVAHEYWCHCTRCRCRTSWLSGRRRLRMSWRRLCRTRTSNRTRSSCFCHLAVHGTLLETVLRYNIYISNLSHELRCLPVFENTGHIWNLPSLQKCFAKLYEESWLGFACAVPVHHAQPFIRCAKAQDEDNATSKKYAINALAVRGMAT